jgi:hypothetical protein
MDPDPERTEWPQERKKNEEKTEAYGLLSGSKRKYLTYVKPNNNREILKNLCTVMKNSRVLTRIGN